MKNFNSLALALAVGAFSFAGMITPVLAQNSPDPKMPAASAALKATAAPKTTTVPASLVTAGDSGENIYDAAEAANWAKTGTELAALEAAAGKFKADLKSPSADQKTAEASLDAAMAALDKSVPAKDQQATLIQANLVTNIVADLSAPFHPQIPVEVTKLDFLGRELNIWFAGNNLEKLKTTGVKIASTWAKVQPAVVAKGGAKEAENFGKLVAQVAAAKSAQNFKDVAKPILDQVDMLEKVFTK